MCAYRTVRSFVQLARFILSVGIPGHLILLQANNPPIPATQAACSTATRQIKTITNTNLLKFIISDARNTPDPTTWCLSCPPIAISFCVVRPSLPKHYPKRTQPNVTFTSYHVTSRFSHSTRGYSTHSDVLPSFTSLYMEHPASSSPI